MSMFDSLIGELAGNREIGRSLGGDEQATSAAMQAALPLLISALQRNASRPDGAQALARALDRDHGGAGGGPVSARAANGSAILEHVLGARRTSVEQGLAKSSGLDPAAIARLLEVAAPIVLGALGRAKKQQGLDAQGLSVLLQQEERSVTTRRPEASLLTRLLDQDGDGSALDDVARRGLGMLGGLFRKD